MSRTAWIVTGIAAILAWRRIEEMTATPDKKPSFPAPKGAPSRSSKPGTRKIAQQDWTIRTFTSRYSEAQGKTILDTITTQERTWKTWGHVPGNDRARPSLMLRADQIPIAGQETVDAWTTRTGVALWLEGM